MGKRRTASQTRTTLCNVFFCLFSGIGDITCSFLLSSVSLFRTGALFFSFPLFVPLQRVTVVTKSFIAICHKEIEDDKNNIKNSQILRNVTKLLQK